MAQAEKRPHETIGIGVAVNKISSSEIYYLKKGGYTTFIGDSRLNYKPEQVLEIYYRDKVYGKLFYFRSLSRHRKACLQRRPQPSELL
jgi:hypothetical protein